MKNKTKPGARTENPIACVDEIGDPRFAEQRDELLDVATARASGGVNTMEMTTLGLLARGLGDGTVYHPLAALLDELDVLAKSAAYIDASARGAVRERLLEMIANKLEIAAELFNRIDASALFAKHGRSEREEVDDAAE